MYGSVRARPRRGHGVQRVKSHGIIVCYIFAVYIYFFALPGFTFAPIPGNVKNSQIFSDGIPSPLLPPTVDILQPLVTPTTAPVCASTMGPPEEPGGGKLGTPRADALDEMSLRVEVPAAVVEREPSLLLAPLEP